MSWSSRVSKEIDIEDIPDNISEYTEPDNELECSKVVSRKFWSNPRFRSNILETECRPTPFFEKWQNHYLIELEELFSILNYELNMKEFQINTRSGKIFEGFCRIIYNKSSKYL
jgi:hypothetical protein